MDQIVTKPALRIKTTGICNRSCSFCNEEGDMRTIGSVEADAYFFECVHILTQAFGIGRVMLTGGEPTIHPQFRKIVQGINSLDISVTTNGIRQISMEEWVALKGDGLRKMIVSIHDASPQQMIRLETRSRQFGWAVQALEAQQHNLVAACRAGMSVRVNTVAYHSRDQALRVLDALHDLQRQYQFEIRLLNDLANIERSQQYIQDACQALGATAVRTFRRAGSSNATVAWETESGFRFSTKMAYRYFFDPICGDCPLKQRCHEGFYGIRLERRLDDYWVRLCIYKHTPDVLMPWREFLGSVYAQQLKEVLITEQR